MQFEVVGCEPVEVARQALPRMVEGTASAIINVGSTALGTAFQRFLAEFGEVLSDAPETAGPFVIDEIELSLSIGATGDLRIASSSANASLKVVLRRPSHVANPTPVP